MDIGQLSQQGLELLESVPANARNTRVQQVLAELTLFFRYARAEYSQALAAADQIVRLTEGGEPRERSLALAIVSLQCQIAMGERSFLAQQVLRLIKERMAQLAWDTATKEPTELLLFGGQVPGVLPEGKQFQNDAYLQRLRDLLDALVSAKNPAD